MIYVHNQKNGPFEFPTVYIGRPSIFGNPFAHKEDTLAPNKVVTRDEAISRYKEYLEFKLKDNDERFTTAWNDLLSVARSGNLHLVCWCSPKKCHGHIIKELLEAELLKEIKQKRS